MAENAPNIAFAGLDYTTDRAVTAGSQDLQLIKQHRRLRHSDNSNGNNDSQPTTMRDYLRRQIQQLQRSTAKFVMWHAREFRRDTHAPGGAAPNIYA